MRSSEASTSSRAESSPVRTRAACSTALSSRTSSPVIAGQSLRATSRGLLRALCIDVDHCHRLLCSQVDRSVCVPPLAHMRAGTQFAGGRYASSSGQAVRVSPGGRRGARAAAGDTDLAVEVLDVTLDSAYAEHELRGDRVVRSSLREEVGGPRARALSGATAHPAPLGAGAPSSASAERAATRAASAASSRPCARSTSARSRRACAAS